MVLRYGQNAIFSIESHNVPIQQKVPYFSDHKEHLKSFNFPKNRKCVL